MKHLYIYIDTEFYVYVNELNVILYLLEKRICSELNVHLKTKQKTGYEL